MRPLVLLAALAVSGCSLADGDSGTLPFRTLATVSADAFGPGSVRTARTPAQAAALAAEIGLADPLAVDFARETVVAVGPFGGCPSTNYETAVLEVEAEPNGATVTAEVRSVGPVGGDAITYPVAVVAIEDLPAVRIGDADESLIALRLLGDAADCGL